MRKLAWTLILLALLPIGGAFAEDFKIAESAFKSTVPNSRTKLVDRKTAVAEMGDRGTGRAVETLLWGVGAVDERLEKDLEERARLDRLYEPFNTPKEWQKYENPEKKKEELAAAMAEVDERILDHEAVLEVLLRELRRQTQDEAIDAMSGSAGFRSKNWRVRAYVGDALAGRRSVPSSVPMKLLKDSDARVRSIVAGGFVRRKNDGEGGPDEVVHALTLEMGKILLKENAWQVRAAMVHTLRKLGSKKAIRFLVEALGKETGRLLEDINEALKDLTGQNFQPDYGAWKRWYDANKAEIEGGEDVKGPKKNSRWKKRDGAEFYGLETYSQRLVYIIDCSGSMADPMGSAAVVTGGDDDDSFSGPKIDLAKRELKRTIRGLEKASFFNIIAFNHQVFPWQPKMAPATQKNKNEAYVWVRKLEPEASTYLYGALKKAFDMAGMGIRDPHYNPAVDTIVLLSDGAPTDNTMQANRMDTDKILKAVRGWNRLAKIKIHVIAIDEAKSIEFLKKLASENDGTYIAK